MDFKDDNGEGLFGARNENSVLFSLDSLNALDRESDSSDGAGNANNEASGLINLNMLTQMGDSRGLEADYHTMEQSMLFNQVVTKKKRNTIILIVSAFILVIIVAGVAFWLFNSKVKEEKALTQKEMLAKDEEAKKAEEIQAAKIRELTAELDAAKADAERRTVDQAKIAEEAQRRREQQLEEAAAMPSGGTKKGGGGKKASDGDDKGGGEEKQPAPKPVKKADPAAVKAALAAATGKAAKCGKGGQLNIIIDISAAGKVTKVDAVGGSFKGSATEKCIVTVFQKHAFPPGEVKGVKYSVKL